MIAFAPAFAAVTETVRTTVDLSGSYDMSRSGEYIVTLSSPLQHASLSNGDMLKNANGVPMAIQSAPLRLWVDGSDLLAKGGHTEVGVLIEQSLVGESYLQNFRRACQHKNLRIVAEATIAAPDGTLEAVCTPS